MHQIKQQTRLKLHEPVMVKNCAGCFWSRWTSQATNSNGPFKLSKEISFAEYQTNLQSLMSENEVSVSESVSHHLSIHDMCAI